MEKTKISELKCVSCCCNGEVKNSGCDMMLTGLTVLWVRSGGSWAKISTTEGTDLVWLPYVKYAERIQTVPSQVELPHSKSTELIGFKKDVTQLQFPPSLSLSSCTLAKLLQTGKEFSLFFFPVLFLVAASATNMWVTKTLLWTTNLQISLQDSWCLTSDNQPFLD